MANPRCLLTAAVAALFLFASLAFAGATQGQVSSFQGLKQVVEAIGDPEHTLVVMDDDDTLTMMRCEGGELSSGCQYLGGPAWYSWQEDLTKDDSSSPYRVAANQGDLLTIAALLLAANDMPYTEADVPSVLYGLSRQGVRLMVETARGGSNVAATEQQFTNRQVAGSSYGSFLDLIEASAPRYGADKMASLPSPFIPCGLPQSREVTYRQGVMYVAGQDKGQMLRCMLKRFDAAGDGAAIQHIVFIDDTQKNVDLVYAAFANDTRYTVNALHYDALDAHKAALTDPNDKPKAEALQARADKRWRAIRGVLDAVLLEPVFDAK